MRCMAMGAMSSGSASFLPAHIQHRTPCQPPLPILACMDACRRAATCIMTGLPAGGSRQATKEGAGRVDVRHIDHHARHEAVPAIGCAVVPQCSLAFRAADIVAKHLRNVAVYL